MLGQLNRIAQSYRKSGVAVCEVEGAHFAQVTQNDRALGVFYIHRNEQGGVEAGVLMRHDLTPAERAEALTHDTLIHAEQFADPKMRPTMERLADLERRWPAMSNGEKLGAKQAQLEVEIDAYTRQLERAASTAERENAGTHLAELNAELKDLKAGRVSADEIAPPYLFAKKAETVAARRERILKSYGTPSSNAELEKALDNAGASDYAMAFVRERAKQFAKLDETRTAGVLEGIKGKSDHWIERNLPARIRYAANESETISASSARAQALLRDLEVSDIKRIDASEANKPHVGKVGNYIPPYPDGSDVWRFKLTKATKFIRVHVEKDEKVGRFLLLSEAEYKHLHGDAEEIRRFLRLEKKPAFVTDVHVPAGTEMQV